MSNLSDLLEVYIITYNRCAEVVATVEQLLVSPFAECSITVLDNCSTDDTLARIQGIASGNEKLRYIRNVVNIGAAANAIQPFLMAKTPYTWVVCDDDYLDFSKTADVLAELRNESATLLIVGGHAEPTRPTAGRTADAASLIDQGLNYFRDTSFLPSTIYSTAYARRHIVGCYAFCTMHYPHIAILLGAYFERVSCYVSKNRLVVPSIGTQSYSQTSQMLWWFGLARTIDDRVVRRQFLSSQFVGLLDKTGLYGLLNTLVRMRLFGKVFEALRLYRFRVVGAVCRMIGARMRGIRYR